MTGDPWKPKKHQLIFPQVWDFMSWSCVATSNGGRKRQKTDLNKPDTLFIKGGGRWFFNSVIPFRTKIAVAELNEPEEK